METTEPDDVDIDTLIDDAQPAERSMPLCLAANLQARFEELEAALARAERKSSGADSLAGVGGDAIIIARQMEELREQMIAKTVTVVMRALPRPKWLQLLKMHPPRRNDAGEVLPEDAEGVGVNESTFWPPLIRASWAAPVISKERMTRLLDEVLTDRQFEQLAQLAFAVNRGEVDVPFSLAASRRLRNNSPESDSLAG